MQEEGSEHGDGHNGGQILVEQQAADLCLPTLVH